MSENLEDRLAELEFKWESKSPGTQGAILEAFYALVPEGHEHESRDPGPELLRDYIAALKAERDLLRIEVELNKATLFALAVADETGGHEPKPWQHKRIVRRIAHVMAAMSDMLGVEMDTLKKITDQAEPLTINETDEHDE